MKQYALVGAALFTLSLAHPVAAYAETYRADYTVSAFGLPVGKSSFTTKISGKSYATEGTLRSAGIARIIASINGSLSASGAANGSSITPNAFDVKYSEGKTNKRTTISFAGGNVTKATNSPKVKERGKWVKVQNGDLNNVVDPIAAVMVPAKSYKDVCNRTIRMYDGAMRADIKLSYLRTIPFSADGFKGDAVTCKGRFVPVSGYDAKKEDITFMRDKGGIEVSFSPMGDSGLFAPVAAKLTTRSVTVHIRATRFEQLTN